MLAKSLQQKLNRRALALGAGATLAAIRSAGSLSAQDSPPQATAETGGGVTSEVLLTGLADPRFILIDGGDIYFTEAGTAGDEPMYAPAEAGTPEADAPVGHAGRTGKVSRLGADGNVTAIASDLMSFTFGANGEINGPAGLALDGDGNILVSMSTAAVMPTLPHEGEDGTLLKIDMATGEHSIVADLAEWEITNNPDSIEIYSNPYGLCLVDGVAYIADAAANAIIAVDVASGERSTFAVTGGLKVDFFPPEGNPARDGAQEIDSVPSSVQQGPDGRLYVSYITGGPFPPGLAPIDAFSLDGEKERVIEGLTMTADIAWDSRDRMYASIVSTDLINGGAGRVVRIEDDGAVTVVVDELTMTAGIAFDADDNLYVLTKSTMVPGGGELVKYTGVTDIPVASGTPAPTGESTPEPDISNAPDAYKITFVDTAFEPSELTIPADVDVTLSFENTGFLAHDFVLANPKMVSDVLGNGQTSEMVVNLPAGTYLFYCSQIGHRAMGMEGTLVVV